jgi:hypothetical protein
VRVAQAAGTCVNGQSLLVKRRKSERETLNWIAGVGDAAGWK